MFGSDNSAHAMTAAMARACDILKIMRSPSGTTSFGDGLLIMAELIENLAKRVVELEKAKA